MVSIKTKDFILDDIDFVIFDKDGTFIDIHKYWGKLSELRAKEFIRYFGLSSDFFKLLCDVMGYDIELKKLPPDSPVGLYARGKVQEIILYFLISNNIEASLEDIETVFQNAGQTFIPMQEDYTTIIPEAIDLMDKLQKAGIKMVVVTSDSKKNAVYTIENRNLKKYFENVYGAEDSDTSKTTGDIVKKALKETGFDKSKTICIGDTYDDFLMAKNSGIKACINVSTGVVTSEQHKEFNKYCVNSLSEIEVI